MKVDNQFIDGCQPSLYFTQRFHRWLKNNNRIAAPAPAKGG